MAECKVCGSPVDEGQEYCSACAPSNSEGEETQVEGNEEQSEGGEEEAPAEEGGEEEAPAEEGGEEE